MAMKTLTFTADQTYKDAFRVQSACDVSIDAWRTAGTGSFTLTRTDWETPTGTYHTLSVATDPTLPLTGAALTTTTSLCTTLRLPRGCYGVTIASASTLVLKFDADGKWVFPGSPTAPV